MGPLNFVLTFGLRLVLLAAPPMPLAAWWTESVTQSVTQLEVPSMQLVA